MNAPNPDPAASLGNKAAEQAPSHRSELSAEVRDTRVERFSGHRARKSGQQPAHPDIAAALEAAVGIPPDAALVASVASECLKIAPDVTEAEIALMIADKAKSARKRSVDQPFAYIRTCVLNELRARPNPYSTPKTSRISDPTHPPLAYTICTRCEDGYVRRDDGVREICDCAVGDWIRVSATKPPSRHHT